MSYKKLVLYFTVNDQIVYEIITNQFTQPFMFAFFIRLCHSNSLRSSYSFPINFKKIVCK